MITTQSNLLVGDESGAGRQDAYQCSCKSVHRYYLELFLPAEMSHSRRLLRPILYSSAAALAGGGVLYYVYRPRKLPGSDPASVPPPRYTDDGRFSPPRFPLVKTRDEQIADLKKSSGLQSTAGTVKATTKGVLESLIGSKEAGAVETNKEQEDAEPYDLLVIGGGATGAGIALDAATRGLRVALVEREDFASGTSSKSTKLVHGGVRYLEKAVWDLDYNQYSTRSSTQHVRC